MRTRCAPVLMAIALALSACGSDSAGQAIGASGRRSTPSTTSASLDTSSTTEPRGESMSTTQTTRVPTTTTAGADTTQPPPTTDDGPTPFELFRVSYDPDTDAVIAHTSSGDIRTEPRELPNGPGTGSVWGVVDFDGDGRPEILTLDPQGAHHLWTSIYRVTPDELILSDAFMLGGNLWLTGALDCHDRTGDGIADLTVRDAIYDEDDVAWLGSRTDYEFTGGHFIDLNYIEAELPGPQVIGADTPLPENGVFGPTTCSPVPGGPEELAEDIAFGGRGWLGADDLQARFDDPSIMAELDDVVSVEGPFSVASCAEPSTDEGECWLLAEVTEVGLTMVRDDWDTGWRVTAVQIGHGE